MTTDNENYKEIDYEQFVKELYSKQPKDPNTVIIDLDQSNVNALFEKLITLFKDGLVYFYGNESDKVDLEKLNNDQILLINKYFNSFSINVNFKITNFNDIEKYKQFILDPGIKNLNIDKSDPITLTDLIDYKNIMSDKLEDRKFKLIKGELVYIIWFNFNL